MRKKTPTTEKVENRRKLVQITIDVWADQKEAMERIRNTQGSAVSFQVRQSLEQYLAKMSRK